MAEARPWLLLRYWHMDFGWLVVEAKKFDLQNRLGFVVNLARRLSERGVEAEGTQALASLESLLEHSRLAREDYFYRDPRTDREAALAAREPVGCRATLEFVVRPATRALAICRLATRQNPSPWDRFLEELDGLPCTSSHALHRWIRGQPFFRTTESPKWGSRKEILPCRQMLTDSSVPGISDSARVTAP